jgi:hypothetical protein
LVTRFPRVVNEPHRDQQARTAGCLLFINGLHDYADDVCRFPPSSGTSLVTWWRFTIMPTGPGQKAPVDELLASGRRRMVGCARSLVSLA